SRSDDRAGQEDTVDGRRGGDLDAHPKPIRPNLTPGPYISDAMKISRAGWALGGFALVVSLVWVLVGWRLQPYVENVSDPYAFGLMGRHLAEGKGFAGFGVML